MCLRCNFLVSKLFFLCLPSKRGDNLCIQYTWKEYCRWEGLKILREGRDSRRNKTALENFRNSDWPWVLRLKSVMNCKKTVSNLGPIASVLPYYWPSSIFEFTESSSNWRKHVSQFSFFWLAKNEHRLCSYVFMVFQVDHESFYSFFSPSADFCSTDPPVIM